MKILKRVFLRLFLVITFLITFLVSSLQVIISYKKVKEVSDWKQLQATIVSSDIYSEHRSKGTAYCPKIKVEYYFQKKLFGSDLEIEEAPCRPIKFLVQKTLKQYSTGKNIIILVNPINSLEVRSDNYSLGFMFYLMSFLSIMSFCGILYSIFTPYDKLDRRKIES